MRSFPRYILFLLVVLALLSVAIPLRYGISYPRQAGPQFNEYYRRDALAYIATKQPQIVFVGDSMFIRGVDLKKLAGGTGKSVYGIGVPGSTTALWYAVIKHEMLPSPYKPEALIIIFRDTVLTAPGYRVKGSYFKKLDDYATPDDQLIIERSYVNLMNPLEKLAEVYFPLYGSPVRETLDYHILYSGNRLLLNCNSDCTDAAMLTVFDQANKVLDVLVEDQQKSESGLYTAGMLDFDRQLPRSLLPEIVRLTRENGTQLILIRAKTLRYPVEDSEPPELKAYLDKLSAYLESNGVILLDYGQAGQLKEELFYDPLHFNEKGKALFTSMIVDGLLALPMFNP